MAEECVTGQLRDEEPANPSAGEAEHWVDVYTRLIDFTREILERTTAQLAVMPGPASRHLEDTNIPLLRRELEEFEERRRSFQARLRRTDEGGTNAAR